MRDSPTAEATLGDMGGYLAYPLPTGSPVLVPLSQALGPPPVANGRPDRDGAHIAVDPHRSGDLRGMALGFVQVLAEASDQAGLLPGVLRRNS